MLGFSKATIDDYERDLAVLRSELQLANQGVSLRKQELADLKDDMHEIEVVRDRLHDEVVRLTQELTIAKHKIAALTSQLSEQKGLSERQAKHILELQETIERLENVPREITEEDKKVVPVDVPDLQAAINFRRRGLKTFV